MGTLAEKRVSDLIATDLPQSHIAEESKRRNLLVLAACGVLLLSALPAVAQNVEKAPPGAPYKKVSELVSAARPALIFCPLDREDVLRARDLVGGSAC